MPPEKLINGPLGYARHASNKVYAARFERQDLCLPQ